MAGFSTYLQSAVLNWVKGTAMPAAPSTVFVALFSADPTDAGLTTNEVTTTVRPAGRVAVTFGTLTTAAGTTTMANSAVADFGTAAGAANATWFGVFTAATGGNMLGSDTLSGGNIAQGNAVSFPAGSLTFSSS